MVFERGVYVKEREEKSEGGHGAKRVTTQAKVGSGSGCFSWGIWSQSSNKIGDLNSVDWTDLG